MSIKMSFEAFIIHMVTVFKQVFEDLRWAVNSYCILQDCIKGSRDLHIMFTVFICPVLLLFLFQMSVSLSLNVVLMGLRFNL